jgi:hypothetical protein
MFITSRAMISSKFRQTPSSTRTAASFKSRERKSPIKRIVHCVKKIIPASTLSLVAALLVFWNAPFAFAKPQKKPAGPGQENPDPLVNAAMKNMETGVWSVKGTVTAKKPIKLQGLLSGEDFDLAMEPGVNPTTPMREIVIKKKALI